MVLNRVVVVVVLIFSGIGIGLIFWKQELKYQLPTPVPVDYQPVKIGEKISPLSVLQPGESYFLHFYNPDCPCSRFNARHLKSLVRSYSDSVHIKIILASSKHLEKAKSDLGDELEFIVDSDNSIAKSCGVYATPQAAIIDREGKLYYRGNYNASRYCTARATNFAELSLIALLNDQPSPSFGLFATQSYGCEWDDTDLIQFF